MGNKKEKFSYFSDFSQIFVNLLPVCKNLSLHTMLAWLLTSRKWMFWLPFQSYILKYTLLWQQRRWEWVWQQMRQREQTLNRWCLILRADIHSLLQWKCGLLPPLPSGSLWARFWLVIHRTSPAADRRMNCSATTGPLILRQSALKGSSNRSGSF